MEEEIQEICRFLRDRGLEEENISKIKDNKIDINVVLMMNDENLKAYIPAFGDRLALINHCKRTHNGVKRQKSCLFSKLKRKLKKKKGSSMESESDTDNGCRKHGHLIGNSYAKRKKRRVDFGWAIFDFNTQQFKKLREPTGGGTRKTELDKDTNAISLLNIALDLFFVNKKSPHGHLDEFTYKITDFKLGDLDDAITVGELYELTKFKILRLYLCTTRKNNFSDNRIEKPAINYLNSCISQPSSTLDETSIGDCSLLDFSDIVIFGQSETGTSDMLSETVKDIVSPDSLLSQLPETPRTFSVPEGQSSHTSEILPTVLPRSPSPPPENCIHIRLHRVNIMEELIAYSKNPDIITCAVKFDFVNEKGADATGVSRDVYSTFWNNFFPGQQREKAKKECHL